ncbi:hypothetical protein GCG54_00008353 [Colletotrichum gloeosporioides]|uniref:Heterokaryon incompatibility domain-containing protein n=1 Tax=Colletotrichum gloeosporioides TaxID=474922 RepID=A0A8H4CHG8_COLGL|nr:uncharacterized protein GCG54_00008353 [Colletotrichum gloeosporioides]KAF3803851.1 hypothetical protein GCG54_00008353 [Colletotrichum gloeosporioides]
MISEFSDAPSIWATIQHWIRSCDDKHSLCKVQSTFIPIRLLKLHTSGGERSFRLVLREEVEPGSEYLALSHCWGNKSWDLDLTLRASTLIDLSRGKPLSCLPRTFKDAFVALERLGLQYIWIDRLCIFQDSEVDWSQESSSMHQVFKSAFLCIAALGAENDEGGLYFQRDPKDIKPSVIDLSLFGTQTHVLTSGRYSCFIKKALTTQLYFYGSAMKCIVLRANLMPTGWGSELHYAQWCELLGYYTKCQLTKSRDKLVAISAIAKETKSFLKPLGEETRYLAGIWEAKLPEALAWRVHPDSVCGRRPVDYRAPSWSWAAVDGKIRSSTKSPNSDSLAEVMSAETTLLTDDETGQVTDGAITLQAAVLPATIDDAYPYPEWWKRMKAITSRQVTLSSFHEPGLQAINGSIIESMAQAWVHFDTYDDICTDIQFVPLYIGWSSMLGLALVPEEGKFRRVGVIVVTIPTDKEAALAFIGQLSRQSVVIR